LQLLGRSIHVDGVIDAPELDIDLFLERLTVDLLVAAEHDVANEGALGDDEDQFHAALEILHLELHVVEEPECEDAPDVLGQSRGNERGTDLGGDAAQDDRLLHSSTTLNGDLLDDDRPLLTFRRRLRPAAAQSRQQEDKKKGKTDLPAHASHD